MSLSPLVPLLLAACWIFPVVIISVVYKMQSDGGASSRPKDMKTSLKGIRVDIDQLAVDAREQGWRREGWDGPAEYVKARVTESSQEVMILTPYAQASVSVRRGDAEGRERRRCSLCLN